MEFLKKLFNGENGQPAALTYEQLSERIAADKELKIVNLTDGGYISEEKFKAKETELAGISQQLNEAKEEIGSYKKMDLEGIKQKAEEWETKYETDTAQLKSQLEQQERDFHKERFFDQYKFSSVAARKGIMSEFDQKEFKFSEGKFEGAEDFMKTLTEDDNYKAAFVQEVNEPEPNTPAPQFAQSTGGGEPQGGSPKPFNFGFSQVRDVEK